ncbi:hypothetical protein RGI145_22360 [Roseomonas gilardii]|uniref:Uncharacterized protein n=2 Tax=Roseomonas gilardii TaxID=257708 RepID=A0A1L7AMM5_9PROT|nr:hypothetical protein RGI145_22360 [Roseomonas gilardii]
MLTGKWLCKHAGDLNPAFFAYAMEIGVPAKSLINSKGKCPAWDAWMLARWHDTHARLGTSADQEPDLWWDHLDTLAARIPTGQAAFSFGDAP